MSKIPTLTELYKANVDVRDSLIPEKWKDSFNKFIWGSTCYKTENPDTGEMEFCYFSVDFRRWYYQNEKAILRDEKIDSVIDKDQI